MQTIRGKILSAATKEDQKKILKHFNKLEESFEGTAITWDFIERIIQSGISPEEYLKKYNYVSGERIVEIINNAYKYMKQLLQG